MTLKEFLVQYDQAQSIVLLEGKRKVSGADIPRLKALGRLLAARSEHLLFRSGNALGADKYFSAGVAEIDRNRLQVITPYTGHRQKSNLASETYALNQINLVEEEEVVYQSKSNHRMARQIERYVAGNRDQYALRAAYIIRDTVKVMGTKQIRPASFGLFYDNLQQPRSGGTGHTMKICEQQHIPLIDQRIWFKWLEE